MCIRDRRCLINCRITKLLLLLLQSRTNSDIRLHVVAYPEKSILAYSFVTVYCMNFIIFLCVTLKLFSLSYVPLLAPTPGDATVPRPRLIVPKRARSAQQFATIPQASK